MRFLFTIFTFLLVNNFGIQAQLGSCTPDPMYNDSVGVFPRPFVVGENGQPDSGGIPDTACINTEFSTNFTIISSTFETTFGSITPDSLVIEEISGLPLGLTSQCDPPNCVFYDSTPGCASIYGIPDDEPGTYNLVISGTAYVPIFGAIAVSFPSQQLNIPGEYLLHLRDEGDPACNTSNVDESPISEIRIHPNPVRNDFQINFFSYEYGTTILTITDLTGRAVYTANHSLNYGLNSIDIDMTNYSKGMYLYTFSTGNSQVSGKLIKS